MRLLLALFLCAVIAAGSNAGFAGGDVSAVDPTVLPMLNVQVTRAMLMTGHSCSAFHPELKAMLC